MEELISGSEIHISAPEPLELLELRRRERSRRKGRPSHPYDPQDAFGDFCIQKQAIWLLMKKKDALERGFREGTRVEKKGAVSLSLAVSASKFGLYNNWTINSILISYVIKQIYN